MLVLHNLSRGDFCSHAKLGDHMGEAERQLKTGRMCTNSQKYLWKEKSRWEGREGTARTFNGIGSSSVALPSESPVCSFLPGAPGGHAPGVGLYKWKDLEVSWTCSPHGAGGTDPGLPISRWILGTIPILERMKNTGEGIPCLFKDACVFLFSFFSKLCLSLKLLVSNVSVICVYYRPSL